MYASKNWWLFSQPNIWSQFTSNSHHVIHYFSESIRVTIVSKPAGSGGAISLPEVPLCRRACPTLPMTRCRSEYGRTFSLKICKAIAEEFGQHADGFKKIFDSVEPLPGHWNTDLDDFQKMLVLKCIHADKLTNSMQVCMSKRAHTLVNVFRWYIV